MEWSLKRGQMLVARGMHSACTVQDMLGEGAQAEVYRARIGNQDYALKWYRREYLSADPRLWDRLKRAINSGSPTDQFLWPFDLVSLPHSKDIGGYIMPIKPPEYISLVELMRGKADPSFRSLTNVGFQLAHSFLKLHAIGLCYRDINFGNVFFNPETGDIRVADTDNVDVNLTPGAIAGTPGFMAPEVGRREIEPNATTDRFSLAVLLYLIFFIGHPLKGKRELELPYDVADPDGSRRLCADRPLFVYDPSDESNRPMEGVHDAMLRFWPIYTESLRALFCRSFTHGLHDPEARVMENEWRKEMCSLRDCIFLCPHCQAENFFDIDRAKRKQSLNACWQCKGELKYPARMRISGSSGAHIIALSGGTQLFPHHLEADTYNFSRPLAQMMATPTSLKNLSSQSWQFRSVSGDSKEIRPGETLLLTDGCRIRFGRTEAEMKL